MHQIDLTRFDLNLLVVFEAVMAERHVGRAAARLHLTQSATSHAIGRLRAAFDDPLFIRHPKGVEPTPRASTLSQAIDETLCQIRGIVAPAAPFDPLKLERTFRIGATDHAVLTTLAPVIGGLLETAPHVYLRILPVGRANMAESFDKRGLDFAIGSYPEVPSRIAARSLFADRYVGVARADHPVLAQGFADAASLTRVGYAMVSLSGDASSSFDEVLKDLGLARRVAVTVPHFLALPAVLMQSDLVALLPWRVASRVVEDATLAAFELPVSTPGLETHLLCARDRRAEPAILWMEEMIVRAVAE